MASPIADFVVSLGTDGRIVSQGSLSKVLAKDDKLSKELAEEQAEMAKAEHEVDVVEPDDEAAPKKSDGKLIVAEEISEGHISWASCELYRSCGIRLVLTCCFSAPVPHEHGWWLHIHLLDCVLRIPWVLRAAERSPDVVAWLLGSAIRDPGAGRHQRVLVSNNLSHLSGR